MKLPSNEMESGGGYDVRFVGDHPKGIECCICLMVLREPVQSEECGHRFCKSCVECLKLRYTYYSDTLYCWQVRRLRYSVNLFTYIGSILVFINENEI